jgi:hypothetical protein
MPTLAEVLTQKLIGSFSEEERAQMDDAANQILGVLRQVKKAAEMRVSAAVGAVKQAKIDHERAALLCLYHRRHKWKKADLVRLNTYRLNKAARTRVAALVASKRLGRGSIVPYQSLTERLTTTGRYFVKLFDPTTSGHERIKLLKLHSSWWPQFIEMTYRGEYKRLKIVGVSAPSEKAEQAVADVFCVSRSVVRRMCIAVRKDPASRTSISRSLTVAEFKLWMQSGRLPNHDTCEMES